MKNQPLTTISVCMATRNGERYIEEQLSSILRQIDDRDEVVISDDSSTDRTVEKIKNFKDPRIRLLERSTFFSPVFNAENALRHARGEIIVLADQDDVWMENKASVVRNGMGENARGIQLLVMDGIIVDEAMQELERSIFDKVGSGKGLCKNIYANTYMGCCMAFTRSLLNVALPFPRTIPMHDVWLGLLAELFGTVTFSREATIRYRRHEGAATTLEKRVQNIEQITRRLNLVLALISRYFAIKTAGQRLR